MRSAYWMGSIATSAHHHGGLLRVTDALLTWIERARERRALARLDHRMLADIGVSGADAWAEQRKRFWEK